jgi:Lon protease-like protein
MIIDLLYQVFEPRYRLMMRRAMEGQRVFGMVAHTEHGACNHGKRKGERTKEEEKEGRPRVHT